MQRAAQYTNIKNGIRGVIEFKKHSHVSACLQSLMSHGVMNIVLWLHIITSSVLEWCLRVVFDVFMMLIKFPHYLRSAWLSPLPML